MDVVVGKKEEAVGVEPKTRKAWTSGDRIVLMVCSRKQ